MKLFWWLFALATATVGIVILLHRMVGRGMVLHFVDDEARAKNFDAFPPEIPGAEFDEVDFFS